LSATHVAARSGIERLGDVLEEVGHRLRRGELRGRLAVEPVLLAEALAASVRQLRDRNLVFPVRHLQRGEVGLPEVAVILLGLLRTHRHGDATRLVPVASLLFDLATAAEDVTLAGDLVRERLLGALVTGDVLHLGAVGFGEGFLSYRPVVDVLVGDQRDVGVDAEAPVAGRIEDAEVLEDLF